MASADALPTSSSDRIRFAAASRYRFNPCILFCPIWDFLIYGDDFDLLTAHGHDIAHGLADQ